MNKLDKQYTDLLQDILDNGVKKQDRTGTGTISVFGRQIRHDMKDGFPLLTTKKMPFKTIVTELLWFLRGDTNIKYLVDNGCNIWNGDAYKKYWSNWRPLKEDCGEDLTPYTQEEFINKIKTDDKFAERWGELGPIYGKQWRSWENIQTQDYTMSSGLNSVRNVKTQIDQIANLISDLKTNPDSRRLMVNAWNVGELDQMVLPPCHYGFQVYTRELSLRERKDHAIDILRYESLLDYGHSKNEDDIFIELMDKWNVPTRAISLMWNQRSVDTGLGLPFNIASYGLLLTMLAEEVNMVPDQLIGNLGDVHLYSNHVEPIKEQFGRKLKFPERTEMLKDKMGEKKYNKAVDELIPFGGGMSEYFETYEIPYTTREPLPLPKVTINPNNKMRIGGGIFTYDVGDFTLEDYVSHPTIKLPLSN
jgi:thymidylate synthase